MKLLKTKKKIVLSNTLIKVNMPYTPINKYIFVLLHSDVNIIYTVYTLYRQTIVLKI